MKKLLLALLLVCLLPAAAFAKDARIAAAEEWLGNLKTGQARFTQRGYDGTVQTGNFYISRPGRLRFEYDPPSKDFIVADGVFLHFYDSQQKQMSSAPIGTTLADFLLRPNTRLDGDLKVLDIRESADTVTLVVTQKADPNAGRIQLNFSKDPYTLASWRVIDAQGLTTDIRLDNMRRDRPIPPALFVYKDPSGRNRLND